MWVFDFCVVVVVVSVNTHVLTTDSNSNVVISKIE